RSLATERTANVRAGRKPSRLATSAAASTPSGCPHSTSFGPRSGTTKRSSCCSRSSTPPSEPARYLGRYRLPRTQKEPRSSCAGRRTTRERWRSSNGGWRPAHPEREAIASSGGSPRPEHLPSRPVSFRPLDRLHGGDPVTSVVEAKTTTGRPARHLTPCPRQDSNLRPTA